MACACRKNANNSPDSDVYVEPVTLPSKIQRRIVNTENKSKYIGPFGTDITVEPVSLDVPPADTVKAANPNQSHTSAGELLADAREINLNHCYLCAKKHVERAKDFFEEYHTGYPDHIKNLIESIHVAELDVRRAFIQWQRIMGQLNMGEGELLGKDINQLKMRSEHITLANKIRAERLRLSDDPLYVPNFDDLLIEIHLLQHKVLDSEEDAVEDER